MQNFIGSMLKGVFLFLVFFCPLMAQEQITFYSQTNLIVNKNQEYLKKQIGATREILFINGKYEVLEAKNKNYVGNVSLPAVFHQKKSFIFRKSFPRQSDSNANYFLNIERFSGKITVYLNDQFIFRSKYNYLPQTIPLSNDMITKSENQLVIHLEPWDRLKDKEPGWFPILLPRINNGISGSIYLEKKAPIYISTVVVNKDSAFVKSVIQGEVTVFSDTVITDNYQLEIEYNGSSGNSQRIQLGVIPDSLHKTLQIPFQIIPDSLEFWSNATPHQPVLLCRLKKDNEILDEYLLRIGLRNLSFKQNKLYLNDNPIEMKGINYIYQDPNGIDLFDRELVLKDLLNIQSRGYNTVRVGFFPQVSQFYQLTDSLGILCLQDLSLPLLTHRAFTDSTIFSEIISNVHAFLELVKAHPSVVGIGLNQFFYDETISELSNFSQLNKVVKNNSEWFSYFSHFDYQLVGSKFDEIIMREILSRQEPEQLLLSVEGDIPDSKIIFSALSMPLVFHSDSSQASLDLSRLVGLGKSVEAQNNNSGIIGQFLFNYQDYYFETPSLQVNRERDEKFILNSRGLFNLNRNIKPETEIILKEKWSVNQENQPESPRDIQTYLFLVVGIINFFIFLFTYRSFVDFRKNIMRSIRRPHGFFVELLERRLISHEQSFYLMIIISLNAAVMLGGIIYFFKSHLLLDYLTSLLIPFPHIKYYVATIIWQPYLLILSLTILTIIFLYLYAIPIKIISVFSKSRIRWRQAVATSTWSASPFLLLIPFGLFFYNLLTVLNSYWILGAILLYFHVWYFFRWLNGTRVMAVSSYTRVFIFAVILISLSSVGLYFLIYKNIDLVYHLKVVSRLFYLYT